jgi:O-antigen ligase
LDKAPESKQAPRGLLFAAVAGLFFFVALLKFGNPVILDKLVSPPQTTDEYLYQLWPVNWAYIGLIPVIVVGLLCPNSNLLRALPPFFKLALFLPLAWLVWQFASATQTVDPTVTGTTLKHFTACVALFYLGFFALGRVQNPWPLWLFLTLALLWIVRLGFEQHFGLLEQTRKFFYQQPNWQQAPPEFLKKLASNRIYSTLFYPNTLAGALLLVTPIVLGFVYQITFRLRPHVRWLITIIIAIPALACLVWSGSKAGWLIALILALIALAQSNVPKRYKQLTVAAVLICGLAGFGLRYAGFFQRGSTSVVARFDYWRAALLTGKSHPLFGTGPGTFAIPYAKIKAPESEMARLTHNDFLQQLSDSGALGFATFLAFVATFCAILYRYRAKIPGFVVLGVIGVLLHQTVEFHLYIPAVAWLTFFLMGWLLARAAAKN